ncbi:phosphorylase family protein [Amycolatopsis azurea]|uniref:Purine and other phosphorylase, family 1 n=1 Tax=Amycolatopsis azurea DSM 43854 TaxID=1238180 RepID=M2QFF8_9PSEU|nr:purine and other phosphorylase, family 1 [Amycolatopsis azurea]EMD24767.1 purine and other phosphorylase, family 1 [Amycolatopsis azurea DSM 43854]OOC08257.1 hypothetical protein B0293_05220 [Amycolatopsis azurea DSM 43854]
MILILTALELEGDAVRAHLSGLTRHHHPAGSVFEVGHLTARPDCSVALGVIGMGTVNAAAVTERAIAEFRPDAVVFVGIAGGLRDWIRLGDVVVATRVYAYQGGRIDGEEFGARPRASETAHRLVELARQAGRSGAWPGAANSTATIHFEPVAAGEVVLNSSTAPENDRLRKHYNDAVAVETESSGVALAAHLNDSTPTIVVRGISDRADGTKEVTDSGGWQPVAVATAAAFAVGLCAVIAEAYRNTARPQEIERVVPGPVTVTGGNAVGSVYATGSVRISQRVVTKAQRHPVVAIAIVTVLLSLLGWGGYGIGKVVLGGGTSAWAAVVSEAMKPASSGKETLATGTGTACGVRADRTVLCWGDGGKERVQPEGRFAAVAVGDKAACGLREDQTVLCWNTNSSAQEVPSPEGRFQAITDQCGIRVGGEIACWVGKVTPPPGRYKAISLGRGDLCAVRDDGVVNCWGLDLGEAAVPPQGKFTAVSRGSRHACALREDRAVVCWGSDDEGQSSVPAGTYTAVSVGEEHSCALRADSALVCWGRDKGGQITPPPGSFTALAAGARAEYSCAVRSDGTAQCWGRDGRFTAPPGKFAAGR